LGPALEGRRPGFGLLEVDHQRRRRLADNKTNEGRSKNRRVEITSVAPVEVPTT